MLPGNIGPVGKGGAPGKAGRDVPEREGGLLSHTCYDQVKIISRQGFEGCSDEVVCFTLQYQWKV